MEVLIFFLKMPIHARFGWFVRDLRFQIDAVSMQPQKADLCATTVLVVYEICPYL